MNEYEAERARINALPQMDYEATFNLKMKYLRRLYAQEVLRRCRARASVHSWTTIRNG